MDKVIGYARVSTRSQETDRQIADLLGAGVRRDDLYTDQRVSGAKASRPGFDKALEALQEGDALGDPPPRTGWGDPPPICWILPRIFGSAESGCGC